MSTDSNRQRSGILLPLRSRTARFASGVRCLRGVKFTIRISKKRVLVTCHTYFLPAVQLLLPLNFSKILRLELSKIVREELQIEQKQTVMANNKKDTKCSITDFNLLQDLLLALLFHPISRSSHEVESSSLFTANVNRGISCLAKLACSQQP